MLIAFVAVGVTFASDSDPSSASGILPFVVTSLIDSYLIVMGTLVLVPGALVGRLLGLDY